MERYYNGVRFGRTPISCVITAVFLAAPSARSADAAVVFPLQAKWTVTLDDSPSFAPAYDTGFGFFALRNNQLVAISLVDGKAAWSVECPTSAAPAAGSGLVFVGVSGAIESRSQKDGEVAWTRPLSDQVTSLYWDTGWLIAATKAGPLVVIRASNGEVLWQRDLGSLPHAPPALAGDRVYVALKDGRLIALSLLTGEVVWTQKMAEPGTGILALADRTYVGSLDDWFYCFDTKNGHRRWRARNGADVVGTPVIDTRRVYFVAFDNVLRALHRRNGGLMWKHLLPMRPTSGPLQVGDTLIVPGPAELHAYKAVDGAAAGDYVMKGAQGEELQLAAPPHLASDDMLILLTRNGQVHALSGTQPPTEPAPAPAP